MNGCPNDGCVFKIFLRSMRVDRDKRYFEKPSGDCKSQSYNLIIVADYFIKKLR